MNFLEHFQYLSRLITFLVGLLYFYQCIYMVYAVFHPKAPKLKEATINHKFAIFMSARNEQGVIGELLDSLNKQDYPKDCFDLYVVADNCTDQTAEVARKHGANVFERFNQVEVGKGYALNYLYKHVTELKGDEYYDAFMVFDADNIVDSQFLKEANKTLDLGKYDAFTTYRNSKNFDQNWITASYSIWFMHEARHLNYPRMQLGAQCMISGTGFVVTNKVMKENQGWPYYFLTEDIQFSVASTLKGYRIGYCDGAMLYDEQPATLKQSWNQRLRWSKGFYQIDGKYVGKLIKGIFTMPKRRLACYDVLMTVLPCSFVMLGIVLFSFYLLAAAWFMPYYVKLVFRQEVLGLLGLTLVNFWLGLMAMGLVTVIMEWDKIQTTSWNKLKHLFMFPFYMLMYLPLSVVALFKKVEWKPIQHYSTKEISSKHKWVSKL